MTSCWPPEPQVRAPGATWRDQEILWRREPARPQGFGHEVPAAMQRRRDFLVAAGFARVEGPRFLPMPGLFSTLVQHDLAAAGRRLQAQSALSYRPACDGQRIGGRYGRSVQLASGRFAMLDDGAGFSPVPWRPAIDQRLGQGMSAVVRGDVRVLAVRATSPFGSRRTRDRPPWAWKAGGAEVAHAARSAGCP